MRIAFKTFGCRANTNDGDALLLEARKRGFSIVAESEPADAYVINTCTVTENADRDARRQAYKFKRLNQGALVAMVGCYSQVAAEEIEKFPEVDFILGTANKFKVLEAFEGKLRNRNLVEDPTGFLPEHFPGSRNARANIKIQDGCNYKCSFCIIPKARGRSRSLPLEVISQQVDEAYAQGFQEVVLTGIHLAHYGWDQGTDLMALVRNLVGKTKGPRVRISTLDPFEIPDELIAMVGKEEKLCPHFHIAIQSGSDKVLKAMKRLHVAREFEEVSHKIQKQDPNTFVGVDVIVGFPGEGEQEFQETLSNIQNSYWSKLHVFSYSDRKGTAADELTAKVHPTDIANRSEKLRAISEAGYNKFLESQVGRDLNVLFERRLKKRADTWVGHSENYVPVLLKSNEDLEKQVRSLKVMEIEGDLAFGVPSLWSQEFGFDIHFDRIADSQPTAI